MNKFNRWLRSKTGMATIIGVVLILLVVVVAGQQLGWWGGGGLSGAAGLPPPPEVVDPVKKFTCLPTCGEMDGKFFVLVGKEMNSLGDNEIVLWITVPGSKTSFDLSIFDGDSSKGANGQVKKFAGHWDTVTTSAKYTLYADPLRNGEGMTVVGEWDGNTQMVNNGWFTVTIENVEAAAGPARHYSYRLVASMDPEPDYGMNQFKVKTTGFLSAATGDLSQAVKGIGIISNFVNYDDIKIVYPQFVSLKNPGPSTYVGEWVFKFYVPNDQERFELWDGDFDRGTTPNVKQDTDDPNTTGKPEWAMSNHFTVDERAGLKGAPADDSSFVYLRRSPAVWYEIIDPDGMPIYQNDEPSGTEEWERFVMSTIPGDPEADLIVDEIKAGMYTLHIVGLDMSNAVWLRLNFPICDEDDCPPPVWHEGSCPRTIGYWKNNVRKWLPYENKSGSPRGVQETKESLNWGLKNVALASELFRSGLDVNNPQPIANAVPLTWAEADKILQRKTDTSMLARALQQNLATWLNLATGKIGPTTVIHLTGIMGGDFDGTIWEALMFAQDVILYHRDDAQLLERAKDIADMINNNEINVDPSDVLACEVYEKIIPPDKQPPAHDKMPKAPKPDVPEEVTPGPEPTCTEGNTYTVENTTENPFHSIKFNFASGDEVKSNEYDTFVFSLPADVVSSMTSMDIEVKAATDSRTIALTCDFTSEVGCGDALYDADGLFGVSFLGAAQNEDGSLALTFLVYVGGDNGLSHVAFSLPSGAAALNMEGSYTTEICVAP